MADEEITLAGNSEEVSNKDIADAEALLRGKEEELKVLEEEVKPKPAEEVVEKVETIETAEETHVEKVIDEHGEKSKEGRQAKRLRLEVADMKAMIRTLVDTQSLSRKEVVDDDPEPELSETPFADEIRAHSQWTIRQAEKKAMSKANEQKTTAEKYVSEYNQMVTDYVDKDDEPELYTALTNTRDLTFNTKLSDDPQKDFLTNFKNAQTYLKGKPPKPNVRGVETKVPTGVNTGQSSKPVSEVTNVDISGWSREEQAVAGLFSPEELKQMKAEKRL